MRILLFLSAMAFVATASTADAYSRDINSGISFLQWCKRAGPNTPSPSVNDGIAQGVCIGTVQTLMAVGEYFPPHLRYCVPLQATNGQAMAVVIRYLESKPERLDIDFITLAAEALRQAWPCP